MFTKPSKTRPKLQRQSNENNEDFPVNNGPFEIDSEPSTTE